MGSSPLNRPYRAVCVWLAALWLGLIGSSVLAASLPTPPIMEGTRAAPLAPSIKVNGVPTVIYLFESDQPLDTLVGFYRRRFGPHHVERRLAGWLLLARQEGELFYTVRLRATSRGTQGTASVLSLKDALAAYGRPLGFRLPPGSEVVSDVETTDPGKRARLLAVTNDLSLQANLDHFKAQLMQRGFAPQREAHGDAGNGKTGTTVWLASRTGEATLVVAPLPQGTSVVVNTIEHDIQEK